VIAFTKRNQRQIKKKAYAKASHIREIRKRIHAYIMTEIAKLSINDVVRHFIGERLNDQITKICQPIYPLQNVLIRKVKVLKRPKIDALKINEMYTHDKRSATIGGKEGEDEAAENVLSKEKRARPPREGGARREGGQRREGGDRPPREGGQRREGGDRPPREGGDRPPREGGQRREGGDRPPREGGERRERPAPAPPAAQ